MILLLLAMWTADAADERRFGLFVGNDQGGPGQERLLFATADARKMRDLFVEHGHIERRDAILLEERGRRDLEHALTDLQQRIQVAEAAGADTVLVFYYSGHGDEQQLALGTSEVSHDELRAWIDATGADARVALLDACQSGGAVREKGGVRGPSHSFDVQASTTRGTAFLTSSAAGEFSQESEDLGGGFFTYYLHSALMGAGDRDGDARVTLTEAYDYVRSETAFHTRHTPGTQTPGFDYDLTGSDDLTLTDLAQSEGWLVFTGDLDGAHSVWDEGRKRYVAEVPGGQPQRLGVPAGTYYVHHRMTGWVEEAAYAVHPGDEITVRPVDFLTMAYEDTAARGDLKRQARKAARPHLNLIAYPIGVRGFGGNTVQNTQYVPQHYVGGVQVRWLPLRKGPYWAFDVVSGGGSGNLSFAEVGTKRVGVQSYSFGGSAGFATGRGIIRAGGGGRVEVIHFRRSFDDGSQPDQSTTSISPGLTGWVGLHYGRMTFDFLTWNLQLLPVAWDGHNVSLYSEILILSVGYRF